MSSRLCNATANVALVCCLGGLAGLGPWYAPLQTALAAESKKSAPKTVQLSNLSDGTFERQLEIPDTENLTPSSPLMEKALDSYATLPFDIGERMRFVITYLGAKGGTAEVLLRTPVKWKEASWAHRITAEVKSAEWYGWVMRLHDSIEGLMDSSAELAPLSFYINQQEGTFRQSKIVMFDEPAGKIRQRTKRKGRAEKPDEFTYAKGTKDALGALYYFRQKVPTGQGGTKFEFPIFTSEKTWTATAQLVRQEKKVVEGREYDTDVYQLYTQFGGLMEQRGDIKLWLTRDARRLPVYTEASIMFGHIKVALVEWDQGYVDPKKKQVFDKIRVKP